mgnify:CR=1 FL=1|jgi:23S rRNA pseudouridine2605 synthase
MKKDQPQRKGRGASERDKASKFSSKKNSTTKKDGKTGERRTASKASFAAKKTPAGRIPAGKPGRKFESRGDSGKTERSSQPDNFKGKKLQTGSGRGREMKKNSTPHDSDFRKNKFVRKKFGEAPQTKAPGFKGKRADNFKEMDDFEHLSENVTPKQSFRKPDTKKPGTKNKTSSDEIRLNRYIANAGVCSRREADVLISDGLIKVNGKVVTELGYKVKKGDTVKYGSKILSPEKLVYILVNKPKDFITTTDDENERKTVMDLVKNVGPERIYPVGRLDRNTTGLLLFTNDGELAEKLMHPSNRTKKLYQAELNKPMTQEDFVKLKNGIVLEDGPIKPDQLEFVTPDGWVIGIQVHEGRNRLVRRMFEHLGYEVTRLDRVMYAGLTKKDLPRGHWRHLTEKEVIKLKHLSH